MTWKAETFFASEHGKVKTVQAEFGDAQRDLPSGDAGTIADFEDILAVGEISHHLFGFRELVKVVIEGILLGGRHFGRSLLEKSEVWFMDGMLLDENGCFWLGMDVQEHC